MAQVPELWQWWHHYYSLVVQWDMKLCFTIVGRARSGDGYRIVTVCIDGSFIVLPQWNIMACNPTQSHYPDTEPTSPYPILIMRSVRLGATSIKLKVIGLTHPGLKTASSGIEPVTFGFPDLPEREASALLIQPSWLVNCARAHSWWLHSAVTLGDQGHLCYSAIKLTYLPQPHFATILLWKTWYNEEIWVLFPGWCFRSLQQLRSYRDGYQIVPVRTHGDWIELPYWEIKLPAPWPQSHYPDTDQSLPYPTNA